jgi:hypothetical protein
VEGKKQTSQQDTITILSDYRYYNIDECFTNTRYLEKPVLGLLAAVSVALLRPVSAASGATRGRSGEDTGVDWLPGSPITSAQGQGSIDIEMIIKSFVCKP